MGTRRGRDWICGWGLVLVACLAPVSHAGDDPVPTTPGTAPCSLDTASFPSYPAIEGNVAFWERVFAEWGLGQVAVHDLDYPALVYEVVDLPGPVEERYTEEQQRFVEELLEAWQDRLRDLAATALAGDELSEPDKRLALEITTVVGTEAIVGADQRVRTQRGLRERFRRGVEIGGRYDAAIRRALSEAGLPEDLVYLPHVESSYQATARSSAGAVGVWQFTRGTGRRFLRIDGALDERLDPVLAARGAAAYLKEAHQQLNDWALALTSYNHGLNGMLRAAAQHGHDYEAVFREYRGRLFGFASRNFYAEFLAAREVACDPARYFPEGLTIESPEDVGEIVLGRRTTPSRMASAWGLPVQRLASVNPAWSSRALRADIALPAGSSVWVPGDVLAGLDEGTVAAAWEGPAATPAGGFYVVRPGDSLSTIARSLGVTLNDLRDWNGMSGNDSLIRVGQRLRLAEPTGLEPVHVVRAGESLSTIARRYDIGVDRLRKLNGIQNGEDLIRVGQRLRVRVADADGTMIDLLVHVVHRGDTLMRIALRYGVSLGELLVHNGLTAETPIYPGQRIRIPR